MDEYTKELLSVYEPPFKYSSGIALIEDAKGRHVLDIRGWGFLTNLLGPDAAASVQDYLGQYIVNQLNNELK